MQLHWQSKIFAFAPPQRNHTYKASTSARHVIEMSDGLMDIQSGYVVLGVDRIRNFGAGPFFGFQLSCTTGCVPARLINILEDKKMYFRAVTSSSSRNSINQIDVIRGEAALSI